MESDARGIKDGGGGDGAARCGWCGKPVRATGAGQRPGYCKGRSCSSKAYRARLKQRQEASLEAALDDSRGASRELESASARQLARLGEITERTASRLAQALDAQAGAMELRVSLSSLTNVAERLLAEARAAVQLAQAGQDGRGGGGLDGSREPLTAEADAPRPQAETSASRPRPSAPEQTPAAVPPTSGPSRPDGSREPSPGAGRNGGQGTREASREIEESTREASTLAPEALARAGLTAPLSPLAVGTARRPDPADDQVPPLTLGPAANWASPAARELGTPRRDYALGDGLVHLTWPTAPGIQALERRGTLAGWIEVYDFTGAWVAIIDGRPVADATDTLPLLSNDPADALTLLRLALRRGLA
ncbi:hypothetical protein [Kitasatospora sp. NPDC001132]